MKHRSIKQTPIPILALLAASAAQAAGAENLQVSAVRFWSLSEATRVVIAVSGEFEYHSERAHDPERVFFDILRSRPRIEGRNECALMAENGVLPHPKRGVAPIRVVGREFWAPWRGVRGPKSAPVEGGNAALISD